MDNANYPIPKRLNLAIAGAHLTLLLGLFWMVGQVESNWAVATLALFYSITMNSAYAMLHEAEHGILQPHPIVNDTVGVLLALFFPAPFHLQRQGHLGHHMRNRSDDEAFDFYFAGDNVVWKYLQLYGILSGFFWLVIALANVLVAVRPALVNLKYASFDRPTTALLQSLNPKYARLMQVEAVGTLLCHAAISVAWQIPVWRHAALLCSFGCVWSAMQYAHHFGTVRDVRKGTRNLKTLWILDKIWLNHNWHLNHHMAPTLPWIYLPNHDVGAECARSSLCLAYLRMWRGPRFTTERVQNRYAGVIIR